MSSRNIQVWIQKVTVELRRCSIVVNHKRVLRLMREAKLTFKKSRFRLITTIIH
ncbi:MAG TPA: hypothetical protein ENK47_01865 [Euryarchaeota archaeon]|nr:hypothetical protein [Euryarchaeota archaeon]